MKIILNPRINVTAIVAGGAITLLSSLALVAPVATATHNAPIPEGDDDSYGDVICMIFGAAGTGANPVDSFMHDSADDDEAWDAANMKDTDGGGFNFTSNQATCVGGDDGGEVIGVIVEDAISVIAGDSGANPTSSRLHEAEYTNLECGTGHAEGSADLYGPGAAPGGPGVGNLTNLKTRFSMDLVDGMGPLAITSFEGVVDLDLFNVPEGAQSDLDDVGHGVDHVQDVDTGIGIGDARIIPTAGMREPGNPDENPPDGDPGDPNPSPVGAPCIDLGVTQFTVDAAFVVTFSGDTDVANDEND